MIFIFFVIKKIVYMNIAERTKYLISVFNYNKIIDVEESGNEIQPYYFQQKKGLYDIIQLQNNMPVTTFCPLKDSMIEENCSFPYVIFSPKKIKKSDKCILLLHGLNERNWNKYLIWADELASRTNTPIILFPMAFHMNRTPKIWNSPRWVLPFSDARKKEVTSAKLLTTFNYVLSQRLSLSPLRFYISGRESVYNIWQLINEIKEGVHPLFTKNTDVNIFSYSIGTFLAQIILMSNPDNLLDNSKLFAFCGGSILEFMDGTAKDILDSEANEKIHKYFLDRPLELSFDNIENAFNQLISKERMKNERECFYKKYSDRVKFITLKNDKVIPTFGVKQALGEYNYNIIGEELDFPYQYSHQIPFPTDKEIDNDILSDSLNMMLSRAAEFLS